MAEDLVRAPSPPAERATLSLPVFVAFVVFALTLVVVASGLLGPPIRLHRGGPSDTAEFQMMTLSDAVNLHCLEHGAVPATLEDLTRPSEKTGKPYVDAVPLDPWRHAYRYRVVDASRRYVEIRSAGEDGRFDTDDDPAWPRRFR